MLDKISDNIIAIAIVIAGLAIAGSLAYIDYNNTLKGNSSNVCENEIEEKISVKEASGPALEYIKGNLVRKGTEVKVASTSEESGVYKMNLTIAGQSGTKAYISKDGKYLFPYGVSLEEKEIPTTDKPKMELYVMSFCPYGNRAENTMKPVYELLGDKVDWEPHYIVSKKDQGFSSLHGAKEVTQDKRELCVLNEHGLGKWFDFVTYVNGNCGSEGDCWKQAAENANIDPNSITTCTEEKGEELLTKESNITKEKGVSGSPALFINGVESEAVYEYGSPNTYKEEICTGFNEAPKECEEKLESNQDTSSGGSCG